VKSWGQFVADNCKNVRIEKCDDDVYLVPQENYGAKGGFSDCAEPILCSESDHADWKSLLTRAFALCK
jgi:hypothetical protein